MVAGKPPHRLLASSLLLRGARAPHQINTATPTPRTQHQPIYRREKGPKSEKWNVKEWENEKCYIHTRSKLPHQPRAHPPIQYKGRKNLQRRKRRKNKGEKQQDEIRFFKPYQCVHTNPCTTNQPIHCSALKHDRKNENWSLKVEFSRCKRAAKFEGNRPYSLMMIMLFIFLIQNWCTKNSVVIWGKKAVNYHHLIWHIHNGKRELH